jgi:CRP/FNR family cyclic AMP-dependent transcriptional regulator
MTTRAARSPLDADSAVTLLRNVAFLADVSDVTLREVFARASQQVFAEGAAIVTELEPGADVFIITAGEAEISVDTSEGASRVIGTLAQGSGFGEMSSITGELRSATVTARTEVRVLVIADRDFDLLREEQPQVALALVRVLGRRIGATERAIDALFGAEEKLAPEVAHAKAIETATGTGVDVRRGSLSRVWRQLVVARRRDIAFLTLAAFVLTLISVRLGVYLAFRFDVAPRGLLRAAYMTGFASLVGSACASLMTYRPGWRRVIAVLYGFGIALIFNELGVTLAFDIFYKDIHTPDPNTPFDIERLYERATAVHAIAIALVVLIQAAYLRRFYARAGFVLMTRLRKLLSR